MKALSIRQPWAWLIVAGIKDVENRPWWTDFRGRIYIHAGKMVDWQSQIAITKKELQLPNNAEKLLPEIFHLGALIGEVDIVDCKFRKDIAMAFSPWHEHGSWGFILANPVIYEVPIPCRGQLGFFEVNMKEVAETKYSSEFRQG